MKAGHTMKSAESGSILLEFILAAPLYLCLWGGLLLISDLLLSKAQLWNSDRMLVHLAGDRFQSIDYDATVADPAGRFQRLLPDLTAIGAAECQTRLADIRAADQALVAYVKELFPGKSPAFSSAAIAESEWVGLQSGDASGGGGLSYQNIWCALYSSQMQLSLGMPDALVGVLTFPYLLTGEKSPFSGMRWDFYTGGTGMMNRDLDRAYVLRRLPECLLDASGNTVSVEPLRRGTDAEKLMSDEVVWAIIGDNWIHDETVAPATTTTVSSGTNIYQDGAYVRNLTAVGE